MIEICADFCNIKSFMSHQNSSKKDPLETHTG